MILVSLGKVAWWSLNPPFWLTEKIFLPLANHISLYVNSRVKRNSYRLALLKCNVTKDTFFPLLSCIYKYVAKCTCFRVGGMAA